MDAKPVRIFITRKLSDADFLYSSFLAHGFALAGRSLIKIQALKIEALPDSTWLFFYSKNGVEVLCNAELLPLIKKKKVAALGTGTARALKQYGIEPDFIGNGIPDDVAENFIQMAQGQAITFIRAAKSKSSIAKRMPETIVSKELIAYENTIDKDAEVPFHDFAILTSSLNAKAYARFAEKLKPVICIGRPTADTAISLGLNVLGVSPLPDEETLFHYSLKMIQKK